VRDHWIPNSSGEPVKKAAQTKLRDRGQFLIDFSSSIAVVNVGNSVPAVVEMFAATSWDG